MQTDPTEADSTKTILAYEGGFTQTWDTVGAGALVPSSERTLQRGAL
jgi:hypothetical protein